MEATIDTAENEVAENESNLGYVDAYNQALEEGYSEEDFLVTYAEDYLSLYQDAYSNALKDPEIAEDSVEFVVYQNEDGDWVIDTKKSDLEDVLGENWFK